MCLCVCVAHTFANVLYANPAEEPAPKLRSSGRRRSTRSSSSRRSREGNEGGKDAEEEAAAWRCEGYKSKRQRGVKGSAVRRATYFFLPSSWATAECVSVCVVVCIDVCVVVCVDVFAVRHIKNGGKRLAVCYCCCCCCCRAKHTTNAAATCLERLHHPPPPSSHPLPQH